MTDILKNYCHKHLKECIYKTTVWAPQRASSMPVTSVYISAVGLRDVMTLKERPT